MDEAVARQHVREGARVVYIDEPGYPTKLVWAEPEAMVAIDIKGSELSRVSVTPFATSDPFRQLRSDWWNAWLREPGEVPDRMPDRGRAMYRRAQAILSEMRAGTPSWLPLERDYILYDAELDFIRVFVSEAIYARPCNWFHDELYQRLWQMPELALVSPPVAAMPNVATYRTTIRSRLALLDAGTHGSVNSTQIIIGVGGRFLALRLDEHGRISEQTLFNPFAAQMTRAKVIEHLSDELARPHAMWTISPVPASLVDDLPRLAAALRKTRAEIIDAYVERIRTGMTISGGPTTDQSWTVSSDGTSFAIRSYEQVDEGYQQRTEPLAESALRTMLATYLMFGLADLPA